MSELWNGQIINYFTNLLKQRIQRQKLKGGITGNHRESAKQMTYKTAENTNVYQTRDRY